MQINTIRVEPNDKRLYDLEIKVSITTPSLLRPGIPEEFTNFLSANGNVETYLWKNENNIDIGYLAISEIDQKIKLEIRSIAVKPEFQTIGIGTTMMQYAELKAKQKNISNLLLATSPNNIIALSFYKKLGYKITKSAENYYGDGTPRLILEKNV